MKVTVFSEKTTASHRKVFPVTAVRCPYVYGGWGGLMSPGHLTACATLLLQTYLSQVKWVFIDVPLIYNPERTVAGNNIAEDRSTGCIHKLLRLNKVQ